MHASLDVPAPMPNQEAESRSTEAQSRTGLTDKIDGTLELKDGLSFPHMLQSNTDACPV